MPTPFRVVTPCLAIALAAGAAHAQWSTHAASNLVVADRSGDQVQPKVRATPDGGCYISWFDNSSGGYDVYLQRLSAAGVEQWAHNGILIADRSVSSTVDYDLTVDTLGNAVITYNDDSATPGGAQQIAVQRIDPAGTLLWGPAGVAITSGSDFKANPHVVALSTGDFVVGYSTGSPQTWIMQKLDSTGAPQWTAPGIVVSEASRYLALSDLQPAGGGAFIALWVRGSSSSPTTSSKALYTQKYDSAGAAQWNTGNPVIVFNTTSIQNGYFPTFLPDGAGGGVYAWYEIGGSRNSYIQHVLSDGSLKFASPVASTGATAGRLRLGAAGAFNASTGEYFLASEEGPASTIADSVIAQKFDTTGARLWGEEGARVRDIGTGQSSFVQCHPSGGGCTVYGINPAGSASGIIFSARVAPAGTLDWSVLASSTPNSRSRLNSALSTQGFVMLAWGNGATGSSDIHAQNVNPDGTLGPAPAPCYPNCDGSTIAPILNVSDFTCFLNKYSAGDPYANCDGSTVAPILNVSDFTCFLNKYSAGCR